VQEKATIARPYARAAFAHAQQEGALVRWSEMLGLLAVIVSDAQMRKILHHPHLSEERLMEFVDGLCGDRLTAGGRNFLKLLVESGRLDVAPEIHEQFERKRADAERISEVEVITAFELDAAQKDRLAELMAKRLGCKVDLSSVVDSSIIGGIVLRAGDSVIDASLRGRLRRLGNELAR
jgi:F-type H+-transporting ATPase subunit delta